MHRTLFLVLLTMAVGYFVIWGLVGLYYKLRREEDDDLQYKKAVTKEMREVTEELREETERFNKVKGK